MGTTLFTRERKMNTKKLKYYYLVIYWIYRVHNYFIFLCSLFQRFGSAWIPLEKHSFCWERSHPCTRSRRVCYRTNAVHELPSPLVHFAVVTDMHHHTERSFVDEFRWVSQLHYLKNGWQALFLFGACCKRGPPSLHYYGAVVLHSCIVLPPVGHSSNHEYHCCQLARQSSCVSNFYRTLNFLFDCPSYFLRKKYVAAAKVFLQNVYTKQYVCFRIGGSEN